METLQIRKATAEDVDGLVRLVNSAYRGDSSRAGWTTEADLLDGQRVDADGIREILARPRHWILLAVASADPGRILGCVELQAFDAEGRAESYFGMLSVDPRQQGRGIGDFLLSSAENFARAETKSRKMHMSVISVRPELIQWYERRGYRSRGIRKPFPYGDERFGIPKRPDLDFTLFEKPL